MKFNILEATIIAMILGLVTGLLPLLALWLFERYPLLMIPFILFSVLIFVCGNHIDEKW